MRARVDDWRHLRHLQHEVDKYCVPPPRREWGAYGRGSFVVPPARVSTPQSIFIGNDVIVHEHVWFSVVAHFPGIVPRLSIGDRTRIGRCCQFSVVQELVIESDVIIGDFVQIGDTYHPYDVDNTLDALEPPMPVHIGRGAIIGSHVVVVPGTTIGAGAYIEHHSVVRAEVEPGSVMAGHPARPVEP